jgi:exodeoxyribonuclease X
MKYLVLDCETTGMDHEKDRVVEVGAALTTATEGIVYDSALVDPGIPIPPEASAIHHLVDEDVRGCETIEEAIKDLLEMPDEEEDGNPVAAYVAHNAPFDRGFLGKHLPELPWIDTLRMARRYLPELPQHGNQYLRYALKLHTPEVDEMTGDRLVPHRALGDALVTAALFRSLVNGLAKADFDGMPLAQFVAMLDAPMLLTRINFGKHKGKLWAEVPRDYLQWLLRNSEGSDPDTIFTAKHYYHGPLGSS